MNHLQNMLAPNVFDVSPPRIAQWRNEVNSKKSVSQSRPIGEMKLPSNHWGARSDAKGGVGKTTTVANLGASLAQGFTNAGVAPTYQPKRVLLVDADAQSNLTSYFLPEFGDDPNIDLSAIGGHAQPQGPQLAAHGYDPALLANHVPNNAYVSSMDRLNVNSVKTAAPMPSVISPLSAVGIEDLYSCIDPPMSGEISRLEPPERLFKCHPHLYGDNLLLVPGSGSLFELDNYLISSNGQANMAQVHSVFPAWLHMTARAVQADYVIIDLGPSANRLNKTILMACDYILPPVYADFFSLNSATHLLKTVLPSIMDLHNQVLHAQNTARAGAGNTGIDKAKKIALGLNVRPTFDPKLLPFLVTNYRTYGNAEGVNTPIVGTGATNLKAAQMLVHLQQHPADAIAPKKLTLGPGKFVASMRNLIDNLQPDEVPHMPAVISMMKGDAPNATAGPNGNLFLMRSMVIPLIKCMPNLVADAQYFGVPMVSMSRALWERTDGHGLNQLIALHPNDGQQPKRGNQLDAAELEHLYARGRFAQLCNMLESLPAP